MNEVKKLTLKQWRLYYNYTQYDVAKKIGVSQATIVKWEHGHSINYSNLKKIMNLYGIEDSSEIELPGLNFWTTPKKK